MNALLLCYTIFSLALSGHVAVADQLHSNANTSAAYRADQTLQGLFDYYWKQDSIHKNIKFLFVCAQIGSIDSYGTCTCVNPQSCVDCYRWWSAVALESVATYGIYRNTSNHSTVPDVIFSHSPYNADWNATAACTYIDDFTWYGIAYLRVYEWLNVSSKFTMVMGLIYVCALSSSCTLL